MGKGNPQQRGSRRLINARMQCCARLFAVVVADDDLCYSGEYANGLITALDSVARPGKFRAYNISAGELISLREMIAVLKRLYPSWHGEAGPGLDYRRLGAGYYFRLALEKARSELGFKPRFDLCS